MEGEIWVKNFCDFFLEGFAVHRDPNVDIEASLEENTDFSEWTAINLGNIAYIAINCRNEERKKKTLNLIHDYLIWTVRNRYRQQEVILQWLVPGLEKITNSTSKQLKKEKQ